MFVIQSKGRDLNSMQNLKNYCQKYQTKKCGKLFTSFNQGKLDLPGPLSSPQEEVGFFYVLENSV